MMSTMATRVVLDARFATDGYPGIGRYVAGLAPALAALDDGPDTVVLRNPGLADSRHGEALAGLTTVETTARPRTVGEQWRLRGMGRRLRADVWHAPYLVLPHLVGVPVVVSLFDATAARAPLVAAATRLAARRAVLVIAPTEAAAAELASACRVPAAKLRVVPLGVSERFRPLDAGARREARARLSLPDPCVLAVGTGRPHKDLDTLVRAVALVDDVHLVLAGRYRPDDTARLRRLVTELGLGRRVQFTGDVAEADLADLYAGADAFVLPSRSEGFGLPLLEAMACGTPVACSDIPSLAEVAGDAAVRFPPGDAHALAAAIGDVLRRRDALTSLGVARATLFPWGRTAQLTAAVYEEARYQP
ncbi:MAG: hypothetical protein QOI99_312 [Actinomycetota bacterium]|nr:hypothetical protein [Actinomycetota bacterium]